MSKVNIIGLSGKIGSGKSLAADIIQALVLDKKLEQYYPPELFTEEWIKQWKSDVNRECSFQQKSFGFKLKEFCANTIGVQVENFEDQDFKTSILPDIWNEPCGNHTFKMTVRQLLQMTGNAMRDSVHPNFWVNALFADYYPMWGDSGKRVMLKKEEYSEGTQGLITMPKWIVTDVRFKNEAEAIKERGGIIIRLERDYHIKSDHSSETDLDNYKFDYLINNNSSVGHLATSLSDILKIIL